MFKVYKKFLTIGQEKFIFQNNKEAFQRKITDKSVFLVKKNLEKQLIAVISPATVDDLQ